MISLRGSGSNALIYTSPVYDHSPYNNNTGHVYTINHNLGVIPNFLNAHTLDTTGKWIQCDSYFYTGSTSYGWEQSETQALDPLNSLHVSMYTLSTGAGVSIRFTVGKF